MIKKWALIATALIIAIFAALTGCAGNNYLSVNGTGVSDSEFLFNLKGSMYSILSNEMQNPSKEFWESKTPNGQNYFELAVDDAVKASIQAVVIEEKYKEYKLKFGEEQENTFNQAYNNLILNFGTKSEYVEYIRQQGMYDEDIVNILKRNIKGGQLKDLLLAEGGEAHLTDDDVKQYFNEDYYRVKHILFTTIDTTTYMPLSEEQQAQAKAEAESTLARLKSGADFDKLMKEKSQDPGSLAPENADGYIFATGEADDAFEKASKSLNAGQMSDIVEGTYGYHIILKLDLHEKPEFFENIKDTVRESAEIAKYNALISKWSSEATTSKNESKINSIDPVELLNVE